MKNTLIILLLVVVAVLAFFLIRREKPTERRKSTEPYVTVSPVDRAGKSIKTRGCEARLGRDNKVCVISIEYLRDMISGSKPDEAIEVRHKDTILWVSWNGETLDVQPLKAMDCSTQQPVTTVPPLIDRASGSGSAQYAHVSDKPDNDGYCYKTNINVTINGQTIPLDPHLFDGGP